MPKESIISALESVRSQGPLVHNITNFVVMNNTANALLSLGASPIMAHAPQEVADLTSLCGSLVINIGTLSDHWIQAMVTAATTAMETGTPYVLDPVGSGATQYRTSTAKTIIETAAPTALRGNASEILSLLDDNAKTKGVDSSQDSDAAIDSAKQLAIQNSCVVCVSGAMDYITDGHTLLSVANGSSLMTKVTGMGCTATAVIGAFLAVHSEPLEAVEAAMAVMGIAGEIAVEKSTGPGTLQVNFLDALHGLSADDISTRFKAV